MKVKLYQAKVSYDFEDQAVEVTIRSANKKCVESAIEAVCQLDRDSGISTESKTLEMNLKDNKPQLLSSDLLDAILDLHNGISLGAESVNEDLINKKLYSKLDEALKKEGLIK